MRCMLLAENTGRKKIAILAPSHNFVGLYLRNWRMYRQSEKNLLNSNTSSTCHPNMVNFGVLTAEIRWRVWGTPCNFNGFRVLTALLHGTLVVGVSQTLRRWTGRHLYSAALAHILVITLLLLIRYVTLCRLPLTFWPWSVFIRGGSRGHPLHQVWRSYGYPFSSYEF